MKDWDLIVKEVLNKGSPDATYNYVNRPENKSVQSQPKDKNKKSKDKKKPTSKRYPLGAKFPNVALTPREAECMVRALQGQTMTKIAASLSLSTRTIEYYMRKIRQKTCSCNKSELIEKILQSDFMKYAEGLKRPG